MIFEVVFDSCWGGFGVRKWGNLGVAGAVFGNGGSDFLGIAWGGFWGENCTNIFKKFAKRVKKWAKLKNLGKKWQSYPQF